MSERFKAFFSYATADWDSATDGETVQFIVNALEQETNRRVVNADFTLWQDRKRLRWGNAWRDKLVETVQDSDLFIPLVSHAWLCSKYCALEYRAFRDHKGTNLTEGRILPILLTEISEDDSAHMTHEQRALYAELRTIQMQVWPDLPSLEAAGQKTILDKCADELKEQIAVMRKRRPDRAPPTEPSFRTGQSSMTAFPINIDETPPITGNLDYRREQDRACLIELATTGLAKVCLEEGEIRFQLRAFQLKFTVTGGKQCNPNTDFIHGWQGPIATVQQIGMPPYYTLLVSERDGPMQGVPLANPQMGKDVRVFDIEPAEGEEVSVAANVLLDWECIGIVSTGDPRADSVQALQKRILSILQKKHAEETPLRGWSDEP